MAWIYFQDKCLQFLILCALFVGFSKRNLVVWGQGKTKPAMITIVTPFLVSVQSLRKKRWLCYYCNSYKIKKKTLFICERTCCEYAIRNGCMCIPKGLYWLAVWIYRLKLEASIIMHQQNDECGCSTCEARGQHVWSWKGRARHYPYNPNEKERTQ